MHTMHCGSTATADAFVPVARSGRRELLDAGDNAAFAWSFDTETYPKAAFTISFADDQELDWEAGPDLRPCCASFVMSVRASLLVSVV